MRNYASAFLKLLCAGACLFLSLQSSAQTLKLTDFAVWGGSASPLTYNTSQGVFIGNAVIIQGNVGSNHRVAVNNLFNVTGNIYSGNIATFGNLGKITGNIFAAKKANNYTGNVITGDYKLNFAGNLTANGKITLKKLTGSNASFVKGIVAVPAPTSVNYIGPTPTGGYTNSVAFPQLPSMPNNSNFDNQVGTKVVTASEIISPGKYKKLALAGSKTITFNGPGNYIFYEVNNGSSANKLVFDFKQSTTGTINIFIIKDANWGRITVTTKNGGSPNRIYTEVHGTGSTNGGVALSIVGPLSVPTGCNVWLGNVWAPNGGISVKSLNVFNAPHIIGALWSAKKVELDQNLKLVYQAPVVGSGPGFIDPYYAPPANGKVSAANNKIGPELAAIAQNPTPITSTPDNEIFIIDNSNRVMIEVISKDPNDATLKAQLVALGMTDGNGVAGTIDNGPHIYTITGFLPINRLSQLTGNTRIEYVRPLYPPISNAGLVTSQGDITMRSNAVRSRFGLDGSDVKIGVISDSYNSKQGAQADVNEGDLPGVKSNGQANDNPTPVQVVADLSDRGNDEGRAMLQIVHDVAPKAKLAFHTGFLSAGQFARAIQTLASPTLPGGKCDVIVDDLTYITEPFQRDGVVAQAVNQVVSQGVTYFSSAGNFGNKSYEATFNGVTNTSVIPTGQIHRFGANATDIYQTINLKPGTYTIGLQWSDEFSSLGSITGVQTDLDLYLLDGNGLQLFGFNRSNLFGDPFEVCAFTVEQETNAKLMIVRASGNINVRFKYIIFRGDGTIVDFQAGTSSIVGHPNADSAIAVGAMLYDNIPPFTPVWPGVASFSSRGGTFTRQTAGATFVQRNKPDLVGPNGVNTTVNLGGAPFNDGDNYPNFFGTSAAAPHVAAVGALIIQGRKKYNLETSVKPWQVRRQLQTSAGKFSGIPGGFSFEGGYGYVQADSAIQQIANAKPIISSLVAVNPGEEKGNQPFAIKIQGKYLVPATKIYVNNTQIATVISIDAATGIGTATAMVPAIPFGQDPEFKLYNPPKSASGEDGGLSEALRFFRSGITILVKADNKGRRYGQENPTLTASVSVVIGEDTTDLDQTSLTLSDLKLTDLTLGTNATTFSNPRSYGISVARSTPLPANDPLLDQYNFEFLAGVLAVEKMPLKITPDSKTLKYGDDIAGITYHYEFDQNGVVSPVLLDEVKALHKKYLADNGVIVLNGFSDIAPLSYLSNMSAMASFQSVLNARKFVVENGTIKSFSGNLPLSRIADQRFIVDVSAASLAAFRQNAQQSSMIEALDGAHARTFLGVKALTAGNARASAPGGQAVPMVNGQLIAMVNGQLQVLINGQLKALVNGILIEVSDLTFLNGSLKAIDVNKIWYDVPSAQMIVTINDAPATVDLLVANGQLQALVNGQPMTPANGALEATVNGQLVTLVNGQLKALVNADITPLVNGQLTAIVNGQLQPLLNGQLRAIVNGQLMALINGELELVQDLILADGELNAVINGQLRPIVNGQLKALVNSAVVDVPTNSVSFVNGQLRAIVNGDPVAYVNGQLKAIVNGQLKALVNGTAVKVESVIQVANGQLKALVNQTFIPIGNGQLQALVNGQLVAMVNGQLMAAVNGELSFIVFQNGQLKALVNEQLEPFSNGQLKAIVNGVPEDVDSYSIVNGQLRAIVNGETWVYPNGQLKALVNGQLRPLVNNFDVSGINNNANTMVLVDEDDINVQAGDVGGMFAMNMITGLDVGSQYIIPAAFVNENFEVTYGLGNLLISKRILSISADPKTKDEGDANPPLTLKYGEFAYADAPSSLCQPVVVPADVVAIDQLERRTTYTDVKLNNASNVYVANAGESITLTGSWNMNHLQNIIPGYQPYCPGCVTQNYVGMTNNDFTGNQFDVCFDVSGTGSVSGTLNTTFTAPTRPGVYYITQKSSWYYSCYQFGHILNDQIANEAIALVIVNPTNGVTANSEATASSPAGDYPIIIGGCYFNNNYRIMFEDATLTVNPGPLESASRLEPGSETIRQSKLYPNPAGNIVRLTLEHDVQTINDIEIFDGMGRLQSATSRKQGEGFYEINVSSLRPGLYMIKTRSASGVKTFKFMKM